MFFLTDKAYQLRGVPAVVRTVLGIPQLLLLAGGAACSAVALIWIAMAL